METRNTRAPRTSAVQRPATETCGPYSPTCSASPPPAGLAPLTPAYSRGSGYRRLCWRPCSASSSAPPALAGQSLMWSWPGNCCTVSNRSSVASAERLRLKVVGGLLRHVPPSRRHDRRPAAGASRKLPFAARFARVYRPVLASYASVDAVARHRARPRRTQPTASPASLYSEGETDDRTSHAGPRGGPDGPAQRARYAGPAGRGGLGGAEPRLGAA